MSIPQLPYIDPQCVVSVLPNSRWIASRIAHAQIKLSAGSDKDVVARELYENSPLSLTRSREFVAKLETVDFTELLDKRVKRGSAENPITKLFPGAITERHFLDELDKLRKDRPSVDYVDERFSGRTLVDFSITEGELRLPVNVKNAGTRFENALQLVGIQPDDCVPIPAYKAHDALEKEPNLLYAIAIDYSLIKKIEEHLIPLFSEPEKQVWTLLNEYAGPLVRDGEDTFIYTMVNKYWAQFHHNVNLPTFNVISARKATRILNLHPKRTPGIGLRAWGTGASAEVNVHISVATETKNWEEVAERIKLKGVEDIVDAVNRKRTEVVFDPEI